MRVLMPLPANDFDPTESAVPWKIISNAGHEVVFATPDGKPGQADPRMLDGRGLGPWKWFLPAQSKARNWYAEMSASANFVSPIEHAQCRAAEFDGLVLAGGHAKGMRPYLESKILQGVAENFFATKKPVGAICHGVVLLARTMVKDTEKSVLHGRRTTALLKSMELSAWLLTVLWLGSYYRTYPITVEKEVRQALGEEGKFEGGPNSLLRDSEAKLERGFTVRDGHYLSARWPGDAHRFATEFVQMLSGVS